MTFSVNHPLIFVIVGIIIAVVLAQSVYFLVKSYRRAKAIGMDMKKIKKTMLTAAIFTIAPAISIVITIIALSNSLGIALPWLRLSVVGSLSYETIAAANAASGMGMTLADLAKGMTASQYITVTVVMTASIMVGIWLVPVVAKRMQRGLVKFEQKDKKWSDILQNSLFIGMISAFVGYVFSDVCRLWLAKDGVYEVITTGDNGEEIVNKFSATSGLVPVLVMLVSIVCMLLCGLAMKKLKWKWLNDYALPICMVLGMAAAIPLTNWLG
jgi:ABC-type Fe3+-siderophore transport system permease subunit